MISVKIEVKEKSLAQRFGKMPAAVLEGVKDGLTALGIELERDVKAAVPHKSGALKRSIAFQLREAGLIPALAIGALIGRPPHAGIKEYGGTIKPRNAKFLTIPFAHGKAVTATGQPRFTARQLFEDPESFGYTGAFIAKGVIFGELRGKAHVERTTGRKVKGPSARGGRPRSPQVEVRAQWHCPDIVSVVSPAHCNPHDIAPLPSGVAAHSSSWAAAGARPRLPAGQTAPWTKPTQQ